MKVLKWIGIVLGGLLALVVVAGLVIYLVGGARFNRSYANIQAAPVAIPTDAESVALGEHIALSRGCTDCHGDNLGGIGIFDDPAVATLSGTNLTSGAGGVGGMMTDELWVRAIRHGVGHDGTGLMIMPSQEYWFMSDRDLGALVAYLKQIPPVDNTLPARRAGPMGRFGLVAGMFPPPAPEMIDHTGPRPPAPEPGVTVEYGEYLTRICTGCHGPDLGGLSAEELGGLPSPDLTTGGEMVGWSEADFITALRTGVKPSGRTLDPMAMPWETIGRATDEELQAMWMYLQSLPPVQGS